MKDFNNIRQFEIPYNFDINLTKILSLLNIQNIHSFYIPPMQKDYIAITRNNYQDNYYLLSEQEYDYHIENIIKNFSNQQLQLLLQSPNQIINDNILKKYINLGFNKFIVGSIYQAARIKDILPSAQITGSITMHISKDMLENQIEYNKFFDNFVLDFSYNKSLKKIQSMPITFKYILLINSFCHTKCNGDQHWFKKINENYYCPGLYLKDHQDFSNACTIRPMDLHLFDPYISIYKLQDRGWTTKNILFDYFLYNSDFSIYPNIIYDINLYEKKHE